MRYFLLILLGFAFTSTLAQPNSYDFEQIDSLQHIEKKSIVVFIHTDWCKICLLMKNTTLQNKTIVEILNQNYYFVTLNGEEKRNIRFLKHTFSFNPTGINTGTHELALELGSINGIISYPSIVILNTNFEIVFQHNSLLNARELKKILETVSN